MAYAEFLQTFKNPKPELLAILRESGPVPGDENGAKAGKGDAAKKKGGRSSKTVDMERLAEGLQQLGEDDLLSVVQMVHDNKAADTYTKNDVESTCKGTMPQNDADPGCRWRIPCGPLHPARSSGQDARRVLHRKGRYGMTKDRIMLHEGFPALPSGRLVPDLRPISASSARIEHLSFGCPTQRISRYATLMFLHFLATWLIKGIPQFSKFYDEADKPCSPRQATC
ncbi:hypothetical protein MRB53_041786 [Persea americana]|nr:hypothetical protein MRB53_041786 [Persea americana]